jgi:hypothetical protein
MRYVFVTTERRNTTVTDNLNAARQLTPHDRLKYFKAYSYELCA